MSRRAFLKVSFLICFRVKNHPLLLVFDSHILLESLAIIRKAIKEDIATVNFSPHLAGKVQPVGMYCLSPFKSQWEKLLAEQANTGPRVALTGLTFVGFFRLI